MTREQLKDSTDEQVESESDDLPFTESEKPLPNDHDIKPISYSIIGLKVTCIFIVMTLILYGLLSFSVLSFLNLNEATKAIVQPYEKWVYLILMVPILYYVVNKSALSLQLNLEHFKYINSKADRVNDIYTMLHKVNHTILRISDKDQLLQEICQIIYEKGHYSFVWIGLDDDETLNLKTLFFVGDGESYIKSLFDSLHSSSVEDRSEPALSSLRKKSYFVVNDVESFSKKMYSWQKRALEHGYHSIAAFPLKLATTGNGVLAVYSNSVSTFTELEVELLHEMSADIIYGISELEQKKKLYHAANFDVVTNLPNRQLFLDRFTQSIKRAMRNKQLLAVMLVKVEDIQNVVSHFGQAVADKLLSEVGNHLTQLTRDCDTVARISENEISVLIGDVSEPHDIAVVSHKLVKPLLIRIVNQPEIHIALRAGVAIFPKDGEDAEILVENARSALEHLDPSDTLGCAFYSKEIGSGIKYSEQIKHELEGAIERREFQLYYQPMVDLNTHRIVGVESLIRWKNQKLGEVSPVQFLPVAEEIGLIETIDAWILKTACLQLIAWTKSGFENITLTVNFLGRHFLKLDSISTIKKIFSSISFDPNNYPIGFEISEEALVDEPRQAVLLFAELRHMGIKVYIDDFGSGYASLNYIHSLPIDALKIDPMFIRTLGKDKNSNAMVQGIMAFATGLQLGTIAEGVETENQIQKLKAMGCQLAQGYFFSPPMTAIHLQSMFNKKIPF